MKGITKNGEVGQEKSLQYLQQLAEKTVVEATELAERIKRDAEDEAAKVVAEAEATRKETAKMVAEAEEKAQKVIDEAQKRADGAAAVATKMVTEAEEKAQKMIGKAQKRADDAATEVTRMIVEAEEKAQKVTDEAQKRADEAVAEAAKMMEEAETTRKETARVVAEAEEKAQKITDEAQKRADDTLAEAAKMMEEAEAARKEATRMTAELEEKAQKVIGEARKRADAIVEGVRKQILSEVEIISNRFLPSIENLTAEICERVATVEGSKQALLKATEEEVKATASGVPISEVENNGHKESLEAATLLPLSDNSALFEGEVEIAILPPVDMAQLIQLRRNLLDTPYLKILRTTGSWNEGSVITVVIDKQLPLLTMLMEIPEVEKVELWAGEEDANGDTPWNSAFELNSGRSQRKRVLVTLKKDLG